MLACVAYLPGLWKAYLLGEYSDFAVEVLSGRGDKCGNMVLIGDVVIPMLPSSHRVCWKQFSKTIFMPRTDNTMTGTYFTFRAKGSSQPIFSITRPQHPHFRNSVRHLWNMLPDGFGG